MGKLNPKIPSPELCQEMTAAGKIMRSLRQRTLTPETLLLTFIRRPGSAAHQLLNRFAEERGFKLKEIESTVETMARMRIGRDVQFEFIDDDGKRLSLSDELTKVLDEGLSIARSQDQVRVHTDHVLAAMAQAGMTTSGVLQRYAMTPTALTEALSAYSGAKGRTTVDYIALAKQGELTPVYERKSLLNELTSLLSLARDRHVILIGPTGVGKRSLVHSLALQLAEGNGLPELDSLVQISETVLVDQPAKALKAGLRRAKLTLCRA